MGQADVAVILVSRVDDGRRGFRRFAFARWMLGRLLRHENPRARTPDDGGGAEIGVTLWRFPHHIFGRFVLAQAEKGGMAEDFIRSPASVLDFGDQLGLHPADVLWHFARMEDDGRPGFHFQGV